MNRPLEVAAYNFLKNYRGKSFLLAVSGGLDSMALLKVFEQLSPKLQLRLTVAHIHHGPSQDPAQQKHRHQSFLFVKNHCLKKKIPFLSNVQSPDEADQLSPIKNSEAALRQLRKEQFRKMWAEGDFDFIVFAHHSEDLFETRMIRLIRGTGAQGLMAMSEQQGVVLRPFLQASKEDLNQYLKSFKMDSKDSLHCTDPSNKSVKYLRNWLRQDWLPRLEKRHPGAIERFQQSIQLILEATQLSPSLDYCFDGERLLRSEYLGLSLSDKRRVWALYLKRLGEQNYGLSHVNELVKRLDVEQKDLTFRLLKKRWLANARHIWCESKNTLE